MANLVLKVCRACKKKQNVQQEASSCYHCRSVLEVFTETESKPPKTKKRHFRHRNQEKVFAREMRR